MAITPYFPTFIYYDDLKKKGGERFNEEILTECYQIRDYDKAGQRWSKKNYLGGYTSYGSMAQLHRFSSTFSELETQINKHVRQYIKTLEMDLRGCEFGMTDCWLNIMPAGVAHSLHLHPQSFISGTYYVQTPQNSAAIKFEDPRLSKFMKAPPKKVNCKRENKQFIAYPAKAGKVVLFESWLRHEVPASSNNSERISISFNYNWW